MTIVVASGARPAGSWTKTASRAPSGAVTSRVFQSMRALSHIPWRPGVFATTRSQRIAFGQGARKEDVIAARAQMRGTRLSTTGSYYKALMAHDELAALESLKDTPVTILVGTRDMLTPPRHAKALAEALPDADAQFLEGKGHMLTYEAPDEVAAAILRS